METKNNWSKFIKRLKKEENKEVQGVSRFSKEDLVKTETNIAELIHYYKVYSEMDFINAIESKKAELSFLSEKIEENEKIIFYLTNDYYRLQEIREVNEEQDDVSQLIEDFYSRTNISSTFIAEEFERKFEQTRKLDNQLENSYYKVLSEHNELVRLYKNPKTEKVLNKLLKQEERGYER